MGNTKISPGEALRALRIRAGLTIEQTAQMAGVSATYLSRVETGVKTATPYWVGAVTEVIAKALRADGQKEAAALAEATASETTI
ncbi:helix-turn-helix transcriptional regulator [Actinomycetaceae bacterium L2_0104]